MNYLVGLCLEEALSKINKNQYTIEIKYTKGLNNKFLSELNEARVVKVDYYDDVASILVCDF
ncbi:hypothetical protein [Abyssisolibacter fermentans]|uniref:hypothetical protein n=1 Tax=Abyssisolibacter fermentans TaxID=1766203 RepID=UPI00082F6800|nr:hypothetical protein [Abyssisolibacter fermentans]